MKLWIMTVLIALMTVSTYSSRGFIFHRAQPTNGAATKRRGQITSAS